MAGMATMVGVAGVFVMGLIGTVLGLALAGWSQSTLSYKCKTIVRACLFLMVMGVAVCLVVFFTDVVDVDERKKGSVVASGFAGVAGLFSILTLLSVVGKRRDPKEEILPFFYAFCVCMMVLLVSVGALVSLAVEWDNDEKKFAKSGAMVMGASGIADLACVVAIIGLARSTVESEEEEDKRLASLVGAGVVSVFCSIVLFGATLVFLTDIIDRTDVEATSKADAIASGAAGVFALIGILTALALVGTHGGDQAMVRRHKGGEACLLVTCVFSWTMVLVAILAIIAWHLDWPGGQGPAVLGGTLGVLTLFLLVAMLYVCAKHKEWLAAYKERRTAALALKYGGNDVQPEPVPLAVVSDAPKREQSFKSLEKPMKKDFAHNVSGEGSKPMGNRNSASSRGLPPAPTEEDKNPAVKEL